MAVPDTTTFTLQDVTTELYGDTAAGRNLSSCFADAVAGSFDSNYNPNADGTNNNLLNFRNYGATSSPYVRTVVGYTTTTSKTVVYNITSLDVVAFLQLNVDSDTYSAGIGTVTVSDSSGATWTKLSGGTNGNVWYTTNLTTTGNRTITVTLTATSLAIGGLTIADCTTDVSNNVHAFAVADTVTVPVTYTALGNVALKFGGSNFGVLSSTGTEVVQQGNGSVIGSVEVWVKDITTLPGSTELMGAVIGGALEDLDFWVIELVKS